MEAMTLVLAAAPVRKPAGIQIFPLRGLDTGVE
jgi:hypothetical protein